MAAVTCKLILQNTRSMLGFPNYGKLPNAVMLFRLYSKLDFYKGLLNVSAQDWLLERWPLTVDAFQDEFPVNAPTGGTGASVGRWVLCLTDDASSPSNDFVRQEVPIVGIQDMDLYFVGNKTVSSSPTEPHVATSFTFFNEGGQLKCRVTPQHTQPADYLFFYEPDSSYNLGINDPYPLLQGFVNLTACDLALSLLPEIAITDPKTHKVLNADEIALRRTTLTEEFGRYSALFETYRVQAIQEQKGSRLGWASDEDPYWEDFSTY